MFGYLLQPWLTVRAQNNAQVIIQDEALWMGFSSFQDMVFWVDTREATIPVGGTITLNMQTAPSKDEVLFQTMQTINLTAAGYTPGLITPLPKVILASAPAVPLGTWVRWNISQTNAAGAWDLTFRILVSANRVC